MEVLCKMKSFDNLPSLTSRLNLQFGYWLDGSTFNLGFLGVDTFVEELLWPGSLLKMLTTCDGHRISKFSLFLFFIFFSMCFRVSWICMLASVFIGV